jgi:hypothetical protein
MKRPSSTRAKLLQRVRRVSADLPGRLERGASRGRKERLGRLLNADLPGRPERGASRGRKERLGRPVNADPRVLPERRDLSACRGPKRSRGHRALLVHPALPEQADLRDLLARPAPREQRERRDLPVLRGSRE